MILIGLCKPDPELLISVAVLVAVEMIFENSMLEANSPLLGTDRSEMKGDKLEVTLHKLTEISIRLTNM